MKKTLEKDLREWKNITRYLDVSYSYVLAKRMEQPKTNPILGYRTAGSRAEFETGEMLAQEMRELGLCVTKDEFVLDGWDFHHARLTYKDSTGAERTAELGGYQTEFDTNGPKQFTVINAGGGTARELDQLDLTGKLALVNINQRDDWWINYPSYQAHIRGAAAVLAVQSGGYGEVDDGTLNAQDFCGPKKAAAFSMSKRDANQMVECLGLSFGETAVVTLDACSKIMPETKSYNIVGTIPGKNTEEMVLVSAHYDSYFEGFQDDNTAVSLMMGMARAIKLSGYKPQKTLVFCALAAEEWGVIDSRYDWSTGAYNQIFRVHPEWAGHVVADINLELPAHAHGKKHQVRSVYELERFLSEQIEALPQKVKQLYPQGAEVICPVQTWSDDFSMAIGGVPSMVNEFGGGRFMATHYHSQYDTDTEYDETVYLFHHLFYTWLLLQLDKTIVPPLSFQERVQALEQSFTNQQTNAKTEAEFRKVLAQAQRLAERLSAFVWQVNEGAIQLSEESRSALRLNLLQIFRLCQDHFVRLDWSENAIFPHENTQANIKMLHTAVWQLTAGMGQEAVASLCEIDDNRYANAFDKQVVDYFADKARNQPAERLMWGAGRLQQRLALGQLLNAIKEKDQAQDADYTKEIRQLEQLEQQELEVLKNILEIETEQLSQLTQTLEKVLNDFEK